MSIDCAGKYPNLSFLVVNDEGNGTYLLGNGERFVQVPEVGARVVGMMDGMRSVSEVHDLALETLGADLDVASFVETLRAAQILEGPQTKVNLFDRIPSRLAASLFSLPAYSMFVMLLLAALAAYLSGVLPFPTYADGLVTPSGAVNLLLLTMLSWVVIAIHESFHVLATRSLGLHAEVSLGIRMQFLVLQANISSIWSAPKKGRMRVYLAGIYADALIFACATLTNLSFGSRPIVGMLALISLSDIAWQMLIYMNTDMYYVISALLDQYNLLASSKEYLRSRLSRSGGSDGASVVVRRYAAFMLLGRLLGIAYFALYTLPVNFVLVKNSVDRYLSGAPGALPDMVIVIGLLVLNVTLYCVAALRQRRGSGS